MLSIYRIKYLSSIRKQLIVFGGRFFSHELLHDNNEKSVSENSFSLANIKKIFKHKFITYNDGFTNFSINCPVCEKNNDAAKVFVNKITGYFVCYQCKHSGNWNSLEMLLINRKTKLLFEKFHQETKQNDEDDVEIKINNILSSTELLSSFDENNFIEILTKFQLPIYSKELYDLIAARFDQNNNCILFPLRDLIDNIVGFKKLTLTRNKVCESTIPIKNCSGLLIGKTNKVRCNQGIIVTSIADFMILLNAKINLNVILLPHSVHSLPQVLLPNFERFSKLIFWFKNDIESWTATRDLAKKLIDTRCYLIRENDPKTAVADTKLLRNLIDGAQPVWHKFITTFSTLRDEVLAELGNIDKVEGVKWKRFPTLTKILKGHRRGELTVVTGPTGSGKTTFISEYSLDLAMQHVNTLWGSFEIRNVRLAKTMLQQLVGVELESNLERFDEFANAFEQLPIYFMTFHGQQSVKIVMEAIEHATYVHDISHVIIDNVQFMMGIVDDSRNIDRFWKQDTIISSFRTFATKRNCHVTLVIHPRKERDSEDLTTSSIFGGAKASQEADNVLIVQDKRLSSIRGKKYIQIAKNRYSGDLGVMPLIFNKTSLSFSEKKQKSNQSDVENPTDHIPT